MDEYYKRSYRAPPGARQNMQKQQEYQLNPIGHMEDSFEEILTKRPGEKKKLKKKANKEPLMQGYVPDQEMQMKAHKRGLTAEWEEVPPNFTVPEKKKRTG